MHSSKTNSNELGIGGKESRSKPRATIPFLSTAIDRMKAAPPARATTTTITTTSDNSFLTIFGNLEVAADDVGEVDQPSLGHAQLDPGQGGHVRRHGPDVTPPAQGPQQNNIKNNKK